MGKPAEKRNFGDHARSVIVQPLRRERLMPARRVASGGGRTPHARGMCPRRTRGLMRRSSSALRSLAGPLSFNATSVSRHYLASVVAGASLQK